MPELPFLTVLAENLRPAVTGRTIADVLVRGVSVLKTADPPVDSLRGRRVIGVRRRGKVLLLDCAGDLVLGVHLMRNGRLRLVPRGTGRQGKDLALILAFDDGPDLQLVELGTKKAASVWVWRTGEAAAAAPLAGLGPEPLTPEWTPDALARRLAGVRVRLKGFLTTQRHVAGIGNAYADEILWEARLSPQAMTDALGADEVARLHGAAETVLRRAIDAHRYLLDGRLPTREPVEHLAVHRHGGEPCPRCGTAVAVIYYEERETYYCPGCQAGGRVYADRRRSRLMR